MKALVLFTAALLGAVLFRACDSSLNKRLEEEKSYTRHAMEYHREHPSKRAGDRVLETWSTADYIAQAVKGQNVVSDWAEFSNRLSFLKPAIQKDPSGEPFCVIQRDRTVLVIDYVQPGSGVCNLEAARGIDTSRIASGDMEFSGRSDYWVYLLRLDNN
jgi:hypothetical protein